MNETLTKDDARKFSELFKALSEGKTIQWYNKDENMFVDCYKNPTYYTLNPFNDVNGFRVKPGDPEDGRKFDLYSTEMVIFSDHSNKNVVLRFFQFESDKFVLFTLDSNNRWYDTVFTGTRKTGLEIRQIIKGEMEYDKILEIRNWR